MAQNRMTRGTAAVGALTVGTGTVVKGVKFGTASVDFASITNAETGSATFTVTVYATNASAAPIDEAAKDFDYVWIDLT